MRVDQFDFELPPDRIALRPARPRDSARLLLVDGDAIADRQMLDLPALLRPATCSCSTTRRSFPPSWKGSAARRGIGATLHKREGPRDWQAFLRNAKRARVGDPIDFGAGVAASVIEKADGRFRAASISTGMSRSSFCSSGRAGCHCRPISPRAAPPTSRPRRLSDDVRARERRGRGANRGAAFHADLLDALDARGIGRETLTLHVGAGTFLPVKADDTDEPCDARRMGSIDGATAMRLNAARARRRPPDRGRDDEPEAIGERGRRGWLVRPFEGDTAIFITPGYRFKAIDGLDHQFPFAQIDPVHAGQRVDGARRHEGGLCACDRATLSLLLLRRLQLVAALGPRFTGRLLGVDLRRSVKCAADWQDRVKSVRVTFVMGNRPNCR